MFSVLSIGTQYFIYKKLKQAGVKKNFLFLFILWAAFWILAGLICGYDFIKVEYDIFPLHVNEIFRALSLTWSIITLIAFFAFFLVDLVTRFNGFTKKKILIAVLITALVTLYGMGEAFFVQEKHIVIRTNKISTDKIRIAYITDSHIGGLSTYRHFERAMKIVNDASPDIFISLGDTIDGDMNYRTREKNLLKAAAQKARLGAYAVNGNHEHYLILDEDVENIIRDCGFNLLINERVEVPGTNITLIGLDDAIHGYMKIFLKPEDKNRFVLVLKHRPGLPFDAENNFDLQISGHTHGGQFWPLVYFKQLAAGAPQGLSHKAGGLLYISNGSGFNGAMMRIFTPPEVTVIDLVREK
ncbi:MAG: metallophosphoesterase [Synergistaceae bacterium]|nr:metallophosphoesterase [Synergistaceae bacterium]